MFSAELVLNKSLTSLLYSKLFVCETNFMMLWTYYSSYPNIIYPMDVQFLFPLHFGIMEIFSIGASNIKKFFKLSTTCWNVNIITVSNIGDSIKNVLSLGYLWYISKFFFSMIAIYYDKDWLEGNKTLFYEGNSDSFSNVTNSINIIELIFNIRRFKREKRF